MKLSVLVLLGIHFRSRFLVFSWLSVLYYRHTRIYMGRYMSFLFYSQAPEAAGDGDKDG